MTSPGFPGQGLLHLLLRLHPREFRERHGEEMRRYLRDAWRADAAGRGPLAALRFWARMAGGTVRTALSQRLGLLARRLRSAAGREIAGASGGRGDVVRALRSLRRRPVFGVVVVLVLALGLGANTAVFSVLHAVVLTPLPYPGPDRIVRLYRTDLDAPGERNYLPAPAFLHYREHAGSFTVLAAFYDYDLQGADLTGGDRPERVEVVPAGAGYFRAVGTEPFLGRAFRRDEEREDARLAVVTHDIWRRYLEADPDAVGGTLVLDGVERTVVGVLPEGFRDPFHPEVDVWVPQDLVPGGYNHWDNYYLSAVGRLAPGVSVEEARAEIEALTRRQGELDSGAEDESGELVPLREVVVGEAGSMLWLLWGAVGLLLLVACVNVANLFIARALARSREMAIRSAVGGGRGHLVREILTESVVLSVVGALAGLGVGAALIRGLIAVAPPGVPRLDALGFGPTILVYGVALSLPAGLLFGLAPAVRAARIPVAEALGSGGRGRTEARRHARLRSALVIGEVAAALVLFIGAGVLVKSFHRIRSAELGIDAGGVTTFRVHLPDARYGEPADRIRFHEELQRRLEALPGVRAAGAIHALPVTGESWIWGTRPRYPDVRETEYYGANQRVVEGRYFEAVGLSLVQGRLLGAEDGPGDPRRVVVNRALAGRLFPGMSAVGRTVRIAGSDVRIVGVVEDAAVDPLGRTTEIVYHDHSQFGDNRNWELHQVVALRSGAGDVLPAARRIVGELDPRLVLFGARPLAEVVGRGVARERFTMLLLTAFAGVAALLAAVGIYGVLASVVSRRRPEFGVRVALGAMGRDVRRLVVREGARMAGAGALLGVPAALLLTRLLESVVHDVSVTDPWVFIASVGGMVAVVAVASWIPAWRATRVDPVEAFRAE